MSHPSTGPGLGASVWVTWATLGRTWMSPCHLGYNLLLTKLYRAWSSTGTTLTFPDCSSALMFLKQASGYFFVTKLEQFDAFSKLKYALQQPQDVNTHINSFLVGAWKVETTGDFPNKKWLEGGIRQCAQFFIIRTDRKTCIILTQN